MPLDPATFAPRPKPSPTPAESGSWAYLRGLKVIPEADSAWAQTRNLLPSQSRSAQESPANRGKRPTKAVSDSGRARQRVLGGLQFHGATSWLNADIFRRGMKRECRQIHREHTGTLVVLY